MRNRLLKLGLLLLGWMLLLCPDVSAARLAPEAAQEFERYARSVEACFQNELKLEAAFLRVDRLPQTERLDAHKQLADGNVLLQRANFDEFGGPIRVPGAMIHHWVGTVFIPGVSLPQVLAVLQDYDRHSTYYSPDVVRSKTLERHGDDFKVYLRLMKKNIVTVVLDTESEVHYERLSSTRARSRSYSTKIAQVENAGQSSERAMPPENDDGFLWRLNSYWQFAEADRGVYVQCEAVSLTRDIPSGLHWLIGTLIESVPRESLAFTLEATRSAVLQQSLHVSR